jgi:hypothetical protein
MVISTRSGRPRVESFWEAHTSSIPFKEPESGNRNRIDEQREPWLESLSFIVLDTATRRVERPADQSRQNKSDKEREMAVETRRRVVFWRRLGRKRKRAELPY